MNETEKLRLDKAVQQKAGISRAEARRLILCGQVMVGGHQCKVLAKEVKSGQITICTDKQPQFPAQPAASIPVPTNNAVLYQDKYIIVINKPAGLICEESHDSRGNSVLDWLPQLLPTHPSDRFYLVHRLDATTTGVLIIARRPAAADNLFAQFRAHTVRKSYLALSKGTLENDLQLDGPLGRTAPGAQKQMVRPDGKEAFTRLTPLSSNLGITLTMARPTTGRTHQIRVHSATAGFPLLGDKLYGGPRLATNEEGLTLPLNRAMLHAYTIDFRHPKSGEPLHFTAPLAADMQELVDFMGLIVPKELPL